MRSRSFLCIATWSANIATLCAAGPPEKLTANCSDGGCHAKQTQGPVLHAPAEKGTCDACHEVKDEKAHKFAFTAEGAKLCVECHEEDAFKGKSIHQPVENGQCIVCHDPHAGKVKGLLRYESEGAMCAECHAELVEGLPVVHGPVAVGQCTTCHSPHASPFPKLVKTEGKNACIECHSEMGEKLSGAKAVHQPVESGCTACHNPHGSKTKGLLASAPPRMCLDCHDDIAEKKDAKFKHSPVMSDAACLSCHDAHASGAKGLLVKSSAGEVCLSCHSKEISAPDGPILNIAAHLADNPHRHGPVESGECGACHDAHGSEHKALASRSYPASFYASYADKAYELCFECHEAEAFATAETDDATGFRNGKRNLHFLHVNKNTKGRSCGACHDPHASKNEKHIAETVPFGKWRLPLNFRANSTGGSCASGCHRAYQYDRETPFDNFATK